jgi:hypothetical protein
MGMQIRAVRIAALIDRTQETGGTADRNAAVLVGLLAWLALIAERTRPSVRLTTRRAAAMLVALAVNGTELALGTHEPLETRDRSAMPVGLAAVARGAAAFGARRLASADGSLSETRGRASLAAHLTALALGILIAAAE